MDTCAFCTQLQKRLAVKTVSLQFKHNVKRQKVAILLCTHQGQRFLAQQLASFEYQTHTEWELWASDDRSEDGTVEILQAFKKKFPNTKVTIVEGPTDGFVSNFLSLACNRNIDSDYFAFADQDDIWKPDKLKRTLQWMQSIPASESALYCSRTELIDCSGRHIGYSPLFKKSPSFRNALTQNIGGGNTMVFNSAARSLLMIAGEQVNVASHDWWTYQVVSGAGGHVYYDQHPSLLYRQHDQNIIGMNTSWVARLKRIRMLLKGRFQVWNEQNISALLKLKNILTTENQITLESFIQCRKSHPLKKIYLLRKCRIYRQTLLGNLGLIAAALLNKL